MADQAAVGWALADTHAHLDDEAFAGDRGAVVARAAAAGVALIVTVGTDLASSRQAVSLAERFAGVYAAVGVHPHDAASLDEATLAALAELARRPRVVAVGETGLDFYRNRAPAAAQRQALRAQLALARQLGLPVIVHDREAHEEILQTLREWARGHADARGVLHAFSGDEAMAREVGMLGFSVSLAGPVTFAKASRLHQLAATLPLDRLVLETDCPYLTPEPLRGRRNEPAYVRLVAERVAALRGLSPAEVARATTANARRLFALP